MSEDKKQTANSQSFEEMSRRLEEIVRQLEMGSTTLVESVKLYAEGADLAKKCNDLLKRAQLKIKSIQDELAETGTDANSDTPTT
jgi:exodeoxyribonuclease VII small subunit